MFKNKAVQMSIVDKKNVGDVSNTTTPNSVDYAKIVEIATESATKVAVVAGAAFAANRVLKTVCDIAVIAAKAKLK